MKNNGILIIIGAGQLQYPYFSFAKKYGLKIALTDRNSNCATRHLAEYFLEADGTDIDKIKKFVMEIARTENIVGVHCGSDFGLKTTAILCELLRIKNVSIESIKISLNKHKAKLLLKENNILTPQGSSFTDIKDALNYFDNLKTKVIVKPIDSSGSQGVSDAVTSENFINAFNEASKFSKEILIEEFIDGRHIDANGFFIDSEFFPLGTGERFKLPSHITLNGIAPAPVNKSTEEKIYKTLEKSSNVMKIKNGPVKADFILKDGDLYLLEIGPRFHGDIYSVHLSNIFLKECLVELYFRYLSNRVPPNMLYTGKTAGIFNIYCEPGYVSEIMGIEKALSIECIKDIILLKKGDFYIKENRDNNSIVGFILAESTNPEKLIIALEEARGNISFRYK